MKLFLIAGVALLLVASGCLQASSNDAMMKDDAMMEKTDDSMMEKTDDSMMEKDDSMMEDDGTMMEKEDDSMMEKDDSMMTKGVEYVPFTQEAYAQAQADGKTIFLEFYANWCPICKAQAPALEEGFSKMNSDSLVAFRVNYKDSETDSFETELAKTFNITYQHTHIVTNASEETLLKSQEDWSVQDVVDKVGVFA